MVNRGMGSMINADRYYTKMVYTDVLNVVLGVSGNVGWDRIRGNDCFDPDPVVGGLSAQGFAAMALMYRRYRVLASSIRVQFVNTAVNKALSVFVFPTSIDLALLITTVQAAKQFESQAYVRTKYLSTAGGMDRAFIKNYISTEKITGSPHAKHQLEYSSLNNNSPAIEWFWNIVGYNMDGTGYVAGSVVISVVVEYYVEWTDRQTLQNL